MNRFNAVWKKITTGPKKLVFLLGGGVTAIGFAINRLNCTWLSSICDAGTIASMTGYSILKNIETKNSVVSEVKKFIPIFDENNKNFSEIKEQLKDIEELDTLLIEAEEKIKCEKNKQLALQNNSNRSVNLNNILQFVLSSASIIAHCVSNAEKTTDPFTICGLFNLSLLVLLPAQYTTHCLIASQLASSKKTVASTEEVTTKLKELSDNLNQNLSSVMTTLYDQQKIITTEIEKTNKKLAEKRALIQSEQKKIDELLKEKPSLENRSQYQILSQQIIDIATEINQREESQKKNERNLIQINSKIEKMENFSGYEAIPQFHYRETTT